MFNVQGSISTLPTAEKIRHSPYACRNRSAQMRTAIELYIVQTRGAVTRKKKEKECTFMNFFFDFFTYIIRCKVKCAVSSPESKRESIAFV